MNQFSHLWYVVKSPVDDGAFSFKHKDGPGGFWIFIIISSFEKWEFAGSGMVRREGDLVQGREVSRTYRELIIFY